MSTGYNFPLSSYLMDLLSGISVCFYDADVEKFIAAQEGKAGSSRVRFEGCILKAYPVESDLKLSRNQLAGVLWKFARNPLAHALGVYLPPSGRPPEDVALAKRRLPPLKLRTLEDSATRPLFCAPTLEISRGPSKDIYDLSLETVYWGVHRMLHSLFADQVEAAKAEALSLKINTFLDIK